MRSAKCNRYSSPSDMSRDTRIGTHDVNLPPFPSNSTLTVTGDWQKCYLMPADSYLWTTCIYPSPNHTL